MTHQVYKRQVKLLLDILPEIAKETCFAIHGGTAVNLFVRNMPRLSVDVDLTYVSVENRALSLRNISEALERIKTAIQKVVPASHVTHHEGKGKLQVTSAGASVKVEVNLINRGVLAEPLQMELCSKAQEDFEVFCTVRVVPFGQLYGGKICAALDRQHPRDLFDIKYLLTGHGFSESVKRGFLLCLVSSERPVNEMLSPHFLDQRSAMINQFAGMTDESFGYEDYEQVRKELIKTIHENLSPEDKHFLLSVKNVAPDWSIYDFRHFPAVAWKLRNLSLLKTGNPQKHQALYQALETLLYSTPA